jgi:hypothetical protein
MLHRSFPVLYSLTMSHRMFFVSRIVCAVQDMNSFSLNSFVVQILSYLVFIVGQKQECQKKQQALQIDSSMTLSLSLFLSLSLYIYIYTCDRKMVSYRESLGIL